MDINCTSHCAYQSDGKCTLNHPPAGQMAAHSDISSNDNDCLYFMGVE